MNGRTREEDRTNKRLGVGIVSQKHFLNRTGNNAGSSLYSNGRNLRGIVRTAKQSTDGIF